MANNKKSELRVKAEKILSQRGINYSEYNDENLEKLIEELNIYQIELEHQNDELRRIQDDLEKKKSKLTDLYDNAPLSYFTIDKDYKIVDVNNKGSELFKQDIKSLRNSKFTDYIHPDSQDVYYHHHRIVISEKKANSCELKLVSISDQDCFVQLESIPTTISDTNKPAIRTAVLDITDRKQKETFKSQLASIVEYSEDGIESMDIEGNILSWNKSAEKIYGYKASEMIGKNAVGLYPKKELAEFRKAIEKIKSGESITYTETKRKRKDGKTIDVSIAFSPLRDREDKVIGTSVITRDITEKIRNKKALKETELKYETIFEESGNAILIMEGDKIISCNKTFAKLLGYSKQEIIGKSPVYFAPEYQFEDVTSEELGREKIKKAYKNGFVGFEWKHKSKKSKMISTYISLKKIEIEGKAYLVSILHDLTEIREYQFKLKERNEEILSQNEEYRVVNEELQDKNEQMFVINKQLDLSEKKFKAAFKTSPDAININRLADGSYIEINDGFSALTGFTEADVNGKTSAEVDIWVNKADRDTLVNGLKELGYYDNLEFEYRKKNGDVSTALMSANIIEINGEKCLLSISRDIGERKRLTNELHKSEQRYRQLVEETHTISWEYDIVRDKWTYVSPQSKTILGYEPQEWLDLEFWVNNLHPNDKNPTFNYCMECTNNGENHVLEYQFRAKDGNYVWLRDVVSVELKNGKPVMMRGVMIDISELRHADEKVRKLSKGIEQSPAICVITDIEGNIEYVNPKFTELTGYTAKEVIGENPRILKSDYHPKEFYTELWNTIKSGRDFRCEMYNKKKNGELYWESALISPIKDNNGVITNFIAIKEDITESKRAEEEIKKLNFKISLANDSAQIGVWDLDLVNNKMDWDENMFKLYGVNPDSFQESYEAWKKALHKDDAQRAIQVCENALHNKGEFHITFRVVWPDKTIRYIEAHAIVIYDNKGKALRMTGVNWDVTEKVLALKQIGKEELRQRSILKLIQTNVNNTQEFLDLALNEAISLTESKLGYIYYYNEDTKQFILNSWSKEVMKDCAVMDPQTCYELDKTGIWGEAVRQRKPIIINDYKVKNPLKKGYPKGHIKLSRFMTVPVFYNNKIVAVVGVANKETDYNYSDQLQLNLLMDSVWKSVEAKRVQDELIKSEKKYRKLTENISDVIWTADLDFKTTYVSPSISKLTGDTAQQHLDKPIEKKIPGKYLTRIKQILKEELQKENIKGVDKNRSVSFETQFYKADGSTLWVMINVAFLRGDNGKVVGLQGVTHDINKRVEREKELRTKDIAIQSSLSAIVLANLNGTIFYVNNAYLSLWGYEKEEDILGTRITDFGKIEGFDKQTIASLKQGIPYTSENRAIRKDGSVFYANTSANLIQDENGKPLYLMVSLIDITERKKAENENANLATMVDIAPNSVVIHDFDGKMLFSNKRHLELHGYTKEEFDKLSLKDINVPESAALIKSRMDEVNHKGEASFEVRHYRKDGSEFPLMIYVKKVDWYGISAMLSIGTDITEREKAKEELQASLERNKAILEANPDLMFVFSDKGEIVDFKAENIGDLYLKPEMFLGKNVKDVMPDDIATLTYEKIGKVKQSGEMELYSYVLKTNGNELYFESRLVPYGKNYFLAIVRDITQQQLDEISLRESKQKLKDAMKTARLGSWELDLINNKLFWSEETFEIFGFDHRKDEPSYNLFMDHVHDDDKKYVDSSYKDSLKDKLPYEIKHRIITERGEIKYVKEKCRTVFDPEGKALKSFGVIQDITDLKRIELDLRKAKEKAEERQNYSKIIAELSKKVIEPEMSVQEIGDLIYEQALKITLSEYGYVATIDLETEDLVCHTMREMMPNLCNVKEKRIAFPKGKDGYYGLFGYSLNTLESFFTNNPMQHETSKGLPNGHVPVLNFLSVPVVVKNKLLGQIALANKPTAYDIFDLKRIEDLANIYGMAIYRKNSEEDIIKAKEKAEESDKLKSAFLANMSHEIRTPMNAIRGFSQLLIEVNFPEEKQKNFLNIINTRTEDLLVLIDDIIDISKIEANQLSIHEEEFALNELLSEIYADKEMIVRTKTDLDFRLEMNTEKEKPFIKTDKNRLKQVLLNLINNAIKFTSKGEIVFGYQIKNDKLEFYVKDTGIGISKDSQGIIFDRFRQVDDSNTRKYGGTGLGLNISKQIVSLLGGDIWVKSSEGKGSTFFFDIPFKPVKKKKNNTDQILNYDWTGKNILIVEDDEVNLYYLCELLEPTKVNIHKSINGNEALKLMKEDNSFDLVLLDINLPDISGNEVVKEVRTFNKTLPIIAQSAYTMKEGIKKGMEYGLNDYITKPIDSKLLLTLIDNYL